MLNTCAPAAAVPLPPGDVPLVPRLWVRLCLRRSQFRLNTFPHAEQLYGLISVWVSRWVFRLERWLKDLLHTGHLCGDSSIWRILWTAKVRSVQKLPKQSKDKAKDKTLDLLYVNYTISALRIFGIQLAANYERNYQRKARSRNYASYFKGLASMHRGIIKDITKPVKPNIGATNGGKKEQLANHGKLLLLDES
nr:unnamed protein product [Callosobruchus analis]